MPMDAVSLSTKTKYGMDRKDVIMPGGAFAKTMAMPQIKHVKFVRYGLQKIKKRMLSKDHRRHKKI